MSEDDESRDMRRLTVSLPAPLLDGVEQVVDRAGERTDLPDLSRAAVLRYLIEQGVESWDDSIEALIPDAIVEEYRVSRDRRRIKKRAYLDDLAGGWRGRVKSALNARLSGDEPYTPDAIRDLATGYRQEAALYWSGDDLRDRESWLDRRVEEYIEAYRAKDAVPDRLFSEVDDVALGSDLRRLQERPEEVVRTVGDVAESEAYDPDAILDRLSSEFGVDVEAIEVLLDALLRDDVDRRTALKSGDGLSGYIPESALIEQEVEEDPALSADLSTPRERYDDRSETLTLSPDEDLPDEEIALDGRGPEVDPEALRKLVDEQEEDL